MAINFPTSPSVNDIYTYGDRRWIFNGTSWISTVYPNRILNITGPTGSQGPVGPTGAQGPTGVGYSINGITNTNITLTGGTGISVNSSSNTITVFSPFGVTASVSSPLTGHVLMWNGSTWSNVGNTTQATNFHSLMGDGTFELGGINSRKIGQFTTNFGAAGLGVFMVPTQSGNSQNFDATLGGYLRYTTGAAAGASAGVMYTNALYFGRGIWQGMMSSVVRSGSSIADTLCYNGFVGGNNLSDYADSTFNNKAVACFRINSSGQIQAIHNDSSGTASNSSVLDTISTSTVRRLSVMYDGSLWRWYIGRELVYSSSTNVPSTDAMNCGLFVQTLTGSTKFIDHAGAVFPYGQI